MNLDKIKTIIGKEWAEVFKNRLVLFTVLFLPLIMTALPLITFGITGSIETDIQEEPLPPEMVGEMCTGLSALDCTQVYMMNLYTVMLMILPVAIPVTIAAYSIVGEKTARSLEPLLATPITTAELLLGKGIAAMAPAVLATWLAYGLYLLGTWLLVDFAVFRHLLDPLWLIAIFIVSPLLTVLSVTAALMISSRVSDPRVAEQLSTVVILPLIMLIIGQSVGFILLDQQLIILIGAIVLLLDIGMVYLSTRLFQREHILTRWK